MRNSVPQESIVWLAGNLIDFRLTDPGLVNNSAPAPAPAFDWEPVIADLHAWRARVARWEAQAYAAIILAAIVTIGFAALAGALTTSPQGLPA